MTEEEEFAFRARYEQEQSLASGPSMPPEPTAPSTLAVAANAVPKGLANILNTPITLANLIMQGISSLPGAGHLQGLQQAAQEPELKANPVRDVMTQTGVIDPAKEPQTGFQRVIDLAVQSAVGAAAVPAGGLSGALQGAAVGATSGAAAQVTKEATGSDLLAAVVGVMTPTALRAISGSTKTVLLNQTSKDTLKEAQEVGYVVEPSSVRAPTSMAEKISGKPAIAQAAVRKNQEITNRLAARSIGLPDDTPLTMPTLQEVRKAAAQPYRDIADISPRAASALDRLQQARFDAKEQWTFYTRSGNPEAGKLARKLDAQAAMYEQVIEKEANKLVKIFGGQAGPKPQAVTGDISESAEGSGTILDRLRAGRQLIARTYTVEKALNLGSGNVSAPVIGRLLDSGAPLTGELRTIGKFAQTFPRVAREVESTPPAGGFATEAGGAALLAAGGAAASGGPAGALAGVAPLLRAPVRNHVLSDSVQRGLLDPGTPAVSAGITAGRTGAVALQEESQ